MQPLYAILYGFGTKSAFVHSTFDKRDDAIVSLTNMRNNWPDNADRFTLHDFETVVKAIKRDEIVLKKEVFGPPPTEITKVKKDGEMAKN